MPVCLLTRDKEPGSDGERRKARGFMGCVSEQEDEDELLLEGREEMRERKEREENERRKRVEEQKKLC